MKNPEPLNIDGNGEYSLDAVGESNYQENLSKLCGGKSEDGSEKKVTATLVYEDGNPYDNKAVRVDIDGLVVGYLKRDHARQIRKQIASAGFKQTSMTCSAIIVGGWKREGRDEGHFGVKLDIPFTP